MASMKRNASSPIAPKIWAIVPVKCLSEAKSRFEQAPIRRNLAYAMARSTLSTLADYVRLSGVVCVTSDPAVRRYAIQNSIEVIDDPERGLNPAFSAGMDRARSTGATHFVLTHSDFARIDPRDLEASLSSFVAACQDKERIGIIRSADGGGTNALFLSANSSFKPRFGVDSFNFHCKAAGKLVLELHAPSLAHDIDSPEDLTAALSLGPAAPDVMRALAAPKLLQMDKLANADKGSIDKFCTQARAVRDLGFGDTITYSPKVFIPLTELCRDVCHYCTFAKSPKSVHAPYLTKDRILEIAKKGAATGCTEALFTLGDRPEERYGHARKWLAKNGFQSTAEYLAFACSIVRDETGLLPHVNAGCLTAGELALLRPSSASMGLMLESASERLCEKDNPHFGSPDKHPKARLTVIEEAGRQRIPFTTGILIGIGETRRERIEALNTIADVHERYGHIQEVIIQNFAPKPGTRMFGAPETPLAEILWTIAVARLIFGPEMSIQAPPNLNMERMTALIDAGINDWGGVSPVTPDFVNPEAPWPEIQTLTQATHAAGKQLAPRLTVYPDYIRDAARWIAPEMRKLTFEYADSAGLARNDAWRAGRSAKIPAKFSTSGHSVTSDGVNKRLDRLFNEDALNLTSSDIAHLFTARGTAFVPICEAADSRRAVANGDTATYVVNRNINYTNICNFKCSFCAFSKGGRNHEGAEKPYLLNMDEIRRRSLEAWEMGATEICLQGGIHPDFTGETYLSILRAAKEAAPNIHIHAFSPLEILHGATTLEMTLVDYLTMLRENGLGSLPGTAAEILNDPIRRKICPDKLSTNEWLTIMEAAHSVGLKSTSTIMFGHVDSYHDWALHLLRIRDLQQRTGGFTEFVPLPFVASEAPAYKRGQTRPGPTLRETILMHAIARLVLHPHIPNIQASWVKLGPEAMKLALKSGANDLGGTLMNESITRAAGALHGQKMSVGEISIMATSLGRRAVQRTTTYEFLDEGAQPGGAGIETKCVLERA